MVAVPLGTGAYKRQFAGMPEIVLQNRCVEKSPSNLVEHSSLITRPGSNGIASCAGGTIRGEFTKQGMFSNDLFVVSGHNLWRISSITGLATQITGTIAGDGFPYVTWMKGIGYEFLFIADGTNFWYYTQHAMGVLTVTAATITNGDIIEIGGIYYGWNTDVQTGTPAGTSSNPYWALLATTDSDDAANLFDSLANMTALLNFSGSVGQYSSQVTAPSTTVTATSADTTMTLTAIADDSTGNSIGTTVYTGGSDMSWAASTLTGGGGTSLAAVTGMGDDEVIKSLTNVSSYVLASVGNTNKFYWLEPGTVVIDPLDYASKESNPDSILDMLDYGDYALIMGNGSTENWYATGNFAAPLAPIEGRVYQRGIIEGTPCVVGDSVMLVGNDGIVYVVGYIYGQDSLYGVHRVSDNAIEERIRVQLRLEQGLRP